MLIRTVATTAAAILLCAVTASAQVTFATHTYPNNNLWSSNEGNNGHVRADLNGDGREDFISTNDASFNSGCAGSFAITLSNADGSYDAPVCYSIPTGVAMFFAVGDFDNDGYLDFVVTNEQGNGWLFLQDKGTGAFFIDVELTFAAEPSGIVAADANHDGNMDLVYSIPNPTGNTQSVQVVWGSGHGNFSLGPVTTYTSTEPPGALYIGDFDNDSHVDVLVVGVSHVVNEILYGQGNGNFTPTATFGPNQEYTPADVFTNGTMDLISVLPPATGTSSNVLDIEYGHYNRILTSQHVTLKSCAVGGNPVLADFDGDGANDIIVAEDADCKGGGPYTLNFMKNAGNGTFQPEQAIYSTGDYIWEWHTMRSSHSSKPDLTVWQSQYVNNQIISPQQLVLVNTTTGNFPPCTPPNFRATGINVCGITSMVVPSSPVTMSFAGAGETPGRDMEIWVDSTKVAENEKQAYSYNDFITATVPITNGRHTISVFSKAWDYFLLLYQIPVNVGVTSCGLPNYNGLLVCSPLQNGQMSSPVTAWASANGVGSITRMEVWVDGVKEYSTFGSTELKTQLTVAPGWHQFAYYAVPVSGGTEGVILNAEVK